MAARALAVATHRPPMGDSLLTSLFGDLGPAGGPGSSKRKDGEGPDAGFAATAILESVATEVNARGHIIDRHSHDLVVSGSPAQAIREHFAATRPDLDTATSLITLVDPAGVWASAVIKALSDAGGRPIERLNLREQTTLRTLATIERTTLVRRHEDTLRIYHADVRVPGPENAEIPVALMERSHLTTVIIGPLQPHSIDALLDTLHGAAMLPTWRCPNLLFMLPPNAVWIANKIGAMPWPGRLHVHVLSESMTGASSVWNAMLGLWNHVKEQPGWDPNGDVALTGDGGGPVRITMLPARGEGAGTDSLFDPTEPGLPAAPSAMRVTRAVRNARSPACSASTACSAVRSSTPPPGSCSRASRAARCSPIRTLSTWTLPPPPARRCCVRTGRRRATWACPRRSKS